jgi:hypothetical protein
VHTLRGSDRYQQVAATAVERTTLSPGEVMVECPREDCEWRTVRPEKAAWSAGEAHRIRHAKGML